jgi:riboflavin kinase/FMN adenylyltransferase
MVWVGPDFRFGAGRAGTINTLKTLGAQYGFTVHTQPVVQQAGRKVSSSAIRQALAQGNVPAAQQLLGHPLVYSGHVVHGQKLGRTLGFPTLNVRINSKASALTGVLAVRVHGLESTPLNGVACLGLRPTVVNSSQLLLETYLPHWPNAQTLYGHDPIDHRQHPENAYGRCIAVEVVAHLRAEQHFANLNDMVEQMHQDTATSMALLNNPECNVASLPNNPAS